jgi:hypothetical protein
MILGPKFRFRTLEAYFRLFDPPKYNILASCSIPVRWIYDTTILIFGPKFHFWALSAIFCLFDPLKYIFSSSILNSWSMDISHDHTDFGPQIPFLGSAGSFSHFRPLKVYIFFIYIKFLIDEYITRPYWFWAPNSVFGLCRLIFAFSTLKSIYFLHLY